MSMAMSAAESGVDFGTQERGVSNTTLWIAIGAAVLIALVWIISRKKA